MGDEIIPIDEKQDDVDNEIVPHNPRDPHNAHNGKQVSLVSLSLNDPEANVYKLPEVVNFITELKVNDKIVCYTYSNSNNINIFEMSTKNQQIKDGDLLIFNNDKISIYHSAHDKISLMSSHRLSSYNEVITGVSIDDNNIWIVSPHYLFHWDFEKFQLKFSYSLRFTTTYTDEDDEGDKSKNIYKKFTVIHKESLIGVKYCNEIAIFLENVHFPIRNIQLKDTDTKIEFCEVQNNDYLLAFNLPKKDEKQNIVLYNINDINKQPIDASMIFNEKKFILYEYNSESKKAFGLVDGKFSYINLLDLNWHEFFESHKEDDDLVGWNDYLGQTFKYYYNDTLAFPDMENIKSLHSPSESKNMKEIRSLFSDEYENKNIATKDINFNNQKYKWRIELKNDELGELSVYSDKEEFLCSKDLGIKFTRLNWKILNNNALALRLNYDNIIIYEYDIHNKCIKTQYFIYKKEGLIDFSGPILPMIDTKDIANLKKDNHKQYFTQLSESIVSIIEDETHERCLAKYGPTLLSNLVKSADPKFTRNIEDIYNKCIKLVKEDPKRNMKFLNIITSSMNDLYKKYPDYIIKFNSEMFMILDPFNERIHSDGNYSHFCTFCDEVEIRKIDQSIKNIIKSIKLIIELIKLIFATILYLAILILLLPFIPFIIILMIICLIMGRGEMIPFLLLAIPFYIVTKQRKQQIVLIIPYIDYSRYPLEYSFWKEIFYPQSSVFVNTCKKEFYSNWNGEAIINFKWKKFGRIYYFTIWLIFMVFLVCFTIASYPTNSITRKVRINLYQTTIAFGFFHLIFELRQFIWNPRKYFLSIWNLFDLSAYLSATIASICWIKYGDIPYWALSISCLLLDLKFLLFFRVFEYFGVYFAIIFGVAKRVFSFLVVLAIIILSFAHAFFLLLHPENLLDSLNAQNPNDLNNPWTLSNTYNQVDENGNILNETLIQVPSENTNLFYSYPTSLLATYLFLTGNQNSLSPWAPKPTTENTILFILMAVFSFLIVIYLMNLFIGLLNMAIEKDNDRALYLVQKAEVIAEIELFYLLPHQRRWRSWFPEVIYYRVDVEKTRIYIKKAIKKGKWNMDDWPEMKHKILKLLSIDDAIINLAV
ncbi:hypothetical protein RhiirA1_457749 [Rhizophagus irregularis]|uniref:Ion transport domain-containing protein n=1 Tax=Rhizophagus irregularis TaxID=588596 RepID=A0A2N0RXI5_9GLOM|nr:hypothetical protein RhiirA1_457749 [Rhizophagus irregularis]